MPESNVELVRRGYEAVLRGDLDLIAELLAPDVQWRGGDSGAEGGCHNRDEAIRFMGRASKQGRPVQLVELIGAGDKVVVIMERRGEDGSSELVANLTTFRDGKVVEMVHYPDPSAARVAAGL